MIKKIVVEMFKVQEGIVQVQVIVERENEAVKMGLVLSLDAHSSLLAATQEFEAAIKKIVNELGVVEATTLVKS